MTYNPGQIKIIYQYLKQPPDWLILGGPADANEAQCFHIQYPSAKIIAIEPCPQMVEWQLANEFPFPNRLIQAALSNEVGTGLLNVGCLGEERCSSLVREQEDFTQTVETQVTTLDQLSETYGPFTNAVLWLDIEGMELPALQGAIKLFESDAIRLVNVEMLLDTPETNVKVEDFILGYGFKYEDHWDRQSGNHYDTIYTKY
jgi:FkbM family methyltransferase